ncbi:MAG: anti-sigma factor [Longimicrobiales bacterium]
MSEHQDWTDFAASYALDALEPEDRVAFETHLESCAACRADVQSYREVAAVLAHAAAHHTPPSSLRSRVLSEARQVRPIQARADGTSGADRAQDMRPMRSPSAPASPHRGARWKQWLPLAACIALALVGVRFYLLERGRRTELEQELVSLGISSRAVIARQDSMLADRDSLINAVLAEDARSITLTAQGQPPSARIYWSRPGGTVVIAAYDLEAAPPGRTYQLWGISGGQPISLGTFNTDAEGRAAVAMRVDPSMTFEVSAITEEPEGGSQQPTTTPFLVGQWPAQR